MGDCDKSLYLQLHKTCRLTTAEIFYHLPDYPSFLQSYIWQDYDVTPKYPKLNEFLTFWSRELEGKLHSVSVTSKGLISPAEFKISSGELVLQ
ncbi:MAG: Usg family protein [Alphaproteobacteria bacterium]|nr:Usg family protein [Alphaproteobacteria bacterium]|tara:strand:- start:2 stop:280 length:279 start_codon:yes stop_codon:yes gene_type:complete